MVLCGGILWFFFFQAEDGIRDLTVTGVQTCALPILAFNSAGDLFCTDQEGATWLPNGNPFDELLHIQPGRHYGFPPRHPKYLPDVIDEIGRASCRERV